MNAEQSAGMYLRQGMLLGTLASSGIDVRPLFDDDGVTYSKDELVVTIDHPTKDDTRLAFTLLTMKVIEV